MGNIMNNPARAFVNLAKEKGNIREIETALDADESLITIKTPSGKTALHKAAEYNNTAIIELLLSRGASIDEKDNELMTPLLLACCCSWDESSQLLIDKGADLTSQTKGGKTALHFTCQNRMGDTSLMLFDGFPEAAKMKDLNGKLPMDLWDDADMDTNLYKLGKRKPHDKEKLVALIEDMDYSEEDGPHE